jgi:putative ABC transport system permease protein
MSPLNRKLLRDLSQLKGQSLAISLVMACGVATFTMSMSVYRSLSSALTTYYDRYRFADVFAQLKRAPNSVGSQIADIPGVAQVQTRVVVDVTLDVPGMKEPAIGRLSSVPDTPRPGLNRVYLRGGRYVEPGHRGEVMVHEAFALAHGFQPGDRLAAVINGSWQQLTIVGIALSPEYVYAIREGEVFPDDRRFGIFWMADSELAPAYDLDGAFNNATVSLTPDANEAEVIRRLDDIIDDYGGAGAFSRDDQLSHKLISGELTQLRGMAVIPPTIFLSVSAFLLNIVMTRLIGLQREQIAVLKAFGYTTWEVAWHYLKFVFVLVAMASVIGVSGGAYLGQQFTDLYAEFFRFPVYDYRLEPRVAIAAIALTAAAAVLGTLSAVRRAIKLPPAEAMRPEPPAEYHETFAERIGLLKLLPFAGRMILRRLGRQPLRAAMTIFGISLSCAVLVMGSFVQDVVTYIVEFQFFRVQRYDVSLGFVEPSSPRAVHDAWHLPGVVRVEPFRGVPARIRFGHRHRRVGITGLVPNPQLFRPLDEHGRPIVLPEEGLAVSQKLADVLGAKVGDVLVVDVLEGERPTREVMLTAVVEDFSGLAAYMDIRAVRRMLREGDTASGVFLSVDPKREDELYAELKETPRVASVAIKAAALRGFEKTMAENLLRMRAMNLMFATIIAFGVIYNTGRIALAERSRELATLRVIGFTRAEVSMLLLGELAVLTVLALPFGMLCGYGLASFAVVALETENQRMPLVIEPSTLAFAATVVMAAATVTGLIVRGRVDRLDLVEVLKSRE